MYYEDMGSTTGSQHLKGIREQNSKIRREELRNFEKIIVDKASENLKLFYKSIRRVRRLS